jgi:hypothetical protein
LRVRAPRRPRCFPKAKVRAFTAERPSPSGIYEIYEGQRTSSTTVVSFPLMNFPSTHSQCPAMTTQRNAGPSRKMPRSGLLHVPTPRRSFAADSVVSRLHLYHHEYANARSRSRERGQAFSTHWSDKTDDKFTDPSPGWRKARVIPTASISSPLR